MILRVIFGAFLIYLFYRFVFDFVLPVLRISRQMHKRVRQFQQTNSQEPASPSAKPQAEPRKPNEDYIDFEEVKE